MRNIIGAARAMVAIVVLMAISAGSAAADSHNEGPRLMPDVFSDNTDVFTSTPLGGAKEKFTSPCDPCGMDAGTGMELFLDAIAVSAWEDDWYDDYDSGDQLDPDFGRAGFTLVNTEPVGGSNSPTSNPVLSAALT